MMGLKNRGTKNVSCPQCGNGLVDFQITKSNEDLIDENISPIKTIAKVICGKCNITSEEVTVKGQFFVGAGQDNVFLDVADGAKGEMVITARFKKYG
jgi:ssDNA-binding Zn-finger/Zn-ribbon topoisomerase 1